MLKKLLYDQKGIALPLVLALMIVMTILSAAAITVSNGQTRIVQKSVEREKAVYAAEQGYNHYLWKLNDNSTFYLDTAKYDHDTSETGYDLYTSKGAENGNYRVQIRVPRQTIDGIEVPVRNRIILRSTGWPESDSACLHTLEVEVSKRTFTQHAMVTNNEVNEYGDTLYWVDGEKMYGPLHTNDTLYVGDYNPVFYGPVTYVAGININPAHRISSDAVFKQGNSQADSLEFVSSNTELLAHSRIDGHYYNGCTYIYLKGNKYDVRRWDKDANTWKFNEVAYTPPASYQNTNKKEREEGTYKHTASGKSYTSFESLRNDTSLFPSLDLPDNGVIFVNGTTGDGGNGGREYEYKFDRSYGNVFVSGKLNGRLTIVAANDVIITGHDPCDWRHPSSIPNFNKASKPGITYSDTDFNQIFSGGDWQRTEVTGAGDDMLGLVADHRMRIIHYNWPCQAADERWNWGGETSWSRIDVAPNNFYIHAALFVRQFSYGFEYAEVGSNKGNINLVGSITQRFRGFVGTTAPTGYTKIYSHDPRMLYDTPPAFVEPANTGWRSAKWRETTNHVSP